MIKETENSFLKVPSIAQIFVAEMLSIWGMTSLVMAIWNTAQPGSFGTMSLKGIGNWIWFLLGLSLFVWSLWQIFVPKVKGEEASNANIFGIRKWRYGFCSTHPSYIFIDFILLVISGFLYWYAKTINFDSRSSLIMMILAGVFPVLRLFAWYVLKLKINSPSAKNAWKAAAWFVIPTFVVFAVIGAFGIYNEIQYPKMIANLPVIDEQNFADSRAKFKQLLENNNDDSGFAKVKTNFVRLRAKQVSDAPVQCKNKDKIDFATVLGDLGAGGDVLIVASNYSNGGFNDLLAKAKDNQGKEIEVIGKLREVTDKSFIEDWKAYCGINNLPPSPTGNRWALEMEMP